MVGKSIESLKKDRQKLASKRSNIEEMIAALKQQLEDNKKADKALKKAERDAVAIERKKNRNIRTRNLIKLATDVLDLFPDLKKRFESSVNKDDYNRSGEIMRQEIVSFILAQKESQSQISKTEKDVIQAPASNTRSEVVSSSTAPVTEEIASTIPADSEKNGTNPALVKDTDTSSSSASHFDFTGYNDTINKTARAAVPGKICPKCKAQALKSTDKYQRTYYYCANSAFWKLGENNCDFHTYDFDELDDKPEEK